jgi:MFS family permease
MNSVGFTENVKVAAITTAVSQRWREGKGYRAFRHRDFRLLWIGALVSFIGSWVQTVAQGFLVYEITGSKEKLALVSFFGMLPVSILGLVAGTMVDKWDKRKLLIACQIGLSCASFFLAFSRWQGFLRVEHILVTALFTGTIAAFEMPARQAVVGMVVPKEDLGAAIPFQALTFNLARVIGPAIGGRLLDLFGPEFCYLLNGCTFSALIYAAYIMRSDLRPKGTQGVPILELVGEGLRYTLKETRLRTLFILEVIVSVFALFYIAQLPAIAKDILHLGKAGLGDIYTVIGIGAVCALALNAQVADHNFKGPMIKIAMTSMAIAMLALSFTRSYFVAIPLFFVIGMSAVVQFNLTNTLFQLISPEKLRGRVISMHVWALSGLGPLGTYIFGWIAEHYGIALSMQIGAVGLGIGVIAFGWLNQVSLEAPAEPPLAEEDDPDLCDLEEGYHPHGKTSVAETNAPTVDGRK